MTGAEVAQIIVATATLVTAMGGVILGLRNSRKIEEVHKATNSLAAQAVASARAEGAAQGNLDGRAEQTAERKAERKDR